MEINGAASYVPFTGYTARGLSAPDAALVAAGPAEDFAGLLGKAREGEAAGAASAPAVRRSAKPVVDKTDKLYEQCEALESFLIKTLLTGMRNTVQKSGLIDEGFAGKMYEDMLYDEYAKDFTKNAGFGLAEMAYLELTGQRGKVISRA